MGLVTSIRMGLYIVASLTSFVLLYKMFPYLWDKRTDALVIGFGLLLFALGLESVKNATYLVLVPLISRAELAVVRDWFSISTLITASSLVLVYWRIYMYEQ